MMMMEAAGIEPASAGSEAEQEEDPDLPSPDAGRSASENSHEVAPNDHDPCNNNGPSGSAAARVDGAGDEPSG
jgi:hypothetical protein